MISFTHSALSRITRNHLQVKNYVTKNIYLFVVTKRAINQVTLMTYTMLQYTDKQGISSMWHAVNR